MRETAFRILVLGCLTVGCSGVRVLPDGTRACTPEALEATRRLSIPPLSQFFVEVLGEPGSVPEVALIREGPIELRVRLPVYAGSPEGIAKNPLCRPHLPVSWAVAPECLGEEIISSKALLYGEASLKGDRVQVRVHRMWDRGEVHPLCGVVAQRHRLNEVGLVKNPVGALEALGLQRLPPGTVAVPSRVALLVVVSESQEPRL